MLWWTPMMLAALSLASTEMANVDRESPRYFCGRTLANARLLYCYEMQDSAKIKKSIRYPLLDALFPRAAPISLWPRRYIQQARAHAIASNRHKRMGIVDQCCLNPCYISELLNYC